MVISKGRENRIVVNGKDVFVGLSWSKEGVQEFEFKDVDQGTSSGVLLMQRTVSGDLQSLSADLVLDGAVIPLIQIPSGILRSASMEQAEKILRARTLMKNAPVYDEKWDQVVNLCRDIRELCGGDLETQRSVETLQEQLRESFDMLRRMDRATVAYEQLGGVDSQLVDAHEEAQQRHTGLLGLLKALHTSVLAVRLTQKTDATPIVDTVSRTRAELEVEKRMKEEVEMKARLLRQRSQQTD